MSNPPDMIGAYARNLNIAMRLQQQGKPVPAQIRQQIDYVEQVAQVQLNPAQIQNAMEHVNRIRLEDNESYQGAFNEAGERYNEIKENKGFETASSGMSPIGGTVSPEQMAQAFNNNGKYTVKNPKKMDIAGLDKHTRKKFGVSLEKFEDRQEHLLNVSLKGDDARTEALAKEYKISPAEQKAYKEHGFEFHWAKKQDANNRSDPDEYEVEMSESAQRKNDIMMATAASHGENVYDEPIQESYLENDDRQGDVARAFAQVEHDEIDEQVNDEMGLNEEKNYG